MRRIALSAIAVAAATVFWPAAGSAAGFSGIVVAKQQGMLFVSSSAGVVRTVHGTASVGSRVRVSGRAIVVGHASRAVVRGIVVRRLGTTLILSSNHHLIAIPNRVGRRLSAVAQAPAAPTGSTVAATIQIANGRIDEENEQEIEDLNPVTITVQAMVTAVGAGTVTIGVQGQSLVVPLPGGLTLPGSLVGQTVSVNVRLGDDNDQGDRGDDDGGHHDGHDGGGGGGDNGGPGGGDG